MIVSLKFGIHLCDSECRIVCRWFSVLQKMHLFVQAVFSSVVPGDFMEGHLTSQINFPTWLGKNSRRSKFERLLQELHMHMRLRYALSFRYCL